jgi:hypothetical protein
MEDAMKFKDDFRLLVTTAEGVKDIPWTKDIQTSSGIILNSEDFRAVRPPFNKAASLTEETKAIRALKDSQRITTIHTTNSILQGVQPRGQILVNCRPQELWCRINDARRGNEMYLDLTSMTGPAVYETTVGNALLDVRKHPGCA